VFDRKTGSYSARGAAQGAPWRPLCHPELPNLDYNFAMALGLVRSLSPVWKPGAWPLSPIEFGKNRMSSVALEWALGEILSLRSLGGPISSYHVLRQWGTDEPFYGLVNLGSPVLGGVLQFTGRPFAKMRVKEISRRFASMLKAREGTAPPLPSRREMRSPGFRRTVYDEMSIFGILNQLLRTHQTTFGVLENQTRPNFDPSTLQNWAANQAGVVTLDRHSVYKNPGESDQAVIDRIDNAFDDWGTKNIKYTQVCADPIFNDHRPEVTKAANRNGITVIYSPEPPSVKHKAATRRGRNRRR